MYDGKLKPLTDMPDSSQIINNGAKFVATFVYICVNVTIDSRERIWDRKPQLFTRSIRTPLSNGFLKLEPTSNYATRQKAEDLHKALAGTK